MSEFSWRNCWFVPPFVAAAFFLVSNQATSGPESFGFVMSLPANDVIESNAVKPRATRRPLTKEEQRIIDLDFARWHVSLYPPGTCGFFKNNDALRWGRDNVACMIQLEAMGCTALARENQDIVSDLVNCEDLTSTPPVVPSPKVLWGCLKGVGLMTADTIVGLEEFAAETIKNMIKTGGRNADFVKFCEKDFGCKRELARAIPRYKGASDELIRKVSVNDLLTEVEASRKSEARVAAHVSHPRPAPVERSDEEENRLKAEASDKRQVLYDYVAKSWQEAATSFSCVKPSKRTQSFCYYAAALLGPKGITKGVRAVQAARADAAFERVVALKRVEAEILENSLLNKSLPEINRGGPKAAKLANEHVFKTMNDLPMKGTAGRTTGATKAQLDALLDDVSNNRVASMCHYDKYAAGGDPGFCWGRAMAAHIEALRSGIDKSAIKKVWIVGDLRSKNVNWRYHVATAVRGSDGAWYAIDPIMEKPVKIEDWFTHFKGMDHAGDARIFATEPSRYGPDVFDNQTKYPSWLAQDASFNGYFSDLLKAFRDESQALVEQQKYMNR